MNLTSGITAWLEAKRINPAVIEAAGVLADGDVLIYPYPCGDRTMWKHRNVVTGGKPWSEPKGLGKSPELMPFCAARASDTATVIFCEGESDALRVASLGGNATVYCIPGSGGFREHWADLALGREHYIVPDADEAGSALAARVAGYLPDIRMVRLHNYGTDACDTDDATLLEAFSVAEPLPLSAVTIPKPQRMTGRRTDYAHALTAEAERDGVVLHSRGDEMVGLCPFHADSTPSLSINEDKGLFYCFGCAAGGSAVDWVMRRTGEDFVTARNYLRGRYA